MLRIRVEDDSDEEDEIKNDDFNWLTRSDIDFFKNMKKIGTKKP